MWERVFRGCLNLLPQNLPGMTEERNDTSEDSRYLGWIGTGYVTNSRQTFYRCGNSFDLFFMVP